MELYFLRHGQAMRRSEWSDDADSRPLTEAGVIAMAHEAWVLARLGVKPDLILTSPLERALQTAGIVAAGLGLEDRLRTESSLSRGFGMKQLRRLLREHAQADAIMLVGHDPELSTVIRKLCGGHVVLTKGGFAQVHLAARKSASAELVNLLQADQLAGLVINHSSLPDDASAAVTGESANEQVGDHRREQAVESISEQVAGSGAEGATAPASELAGAPGDSGSRA